MGIRSSAKEVLQEPLLLAMFFLSFALAVLCVVCYFRCLRPRRGTTEWMKRVDAPKFAPIRAEGLHWSDCAWVLLSGVCAVLLRFVYLFFWLRLHQRPNLFEVLISAGGFFLQRLSLAAGLAVGLYLLIRLLFGKPLPALCAAALSGLTVSLYCDTLLLLTFSLLFLYLWMSREEHKPLFPGALWLGASGFLYALALLTCWQLAWLAPFYLGAYAVKQILRFRKGDPAYRSSRLVLSLFLTLLCLLLGGFALYMAYALLSGRAEEGLLVGLRSFEFYGSFLTVLGEKLKKLLAIEPHLLGSVRTWDAYLFLAGMLGMIPLCHGAFRLRDSRCLWILCLLPPFLCLWLLWGSYLLAVPLLLVLGYEWSAYSRRERGGLALLHAGTIGGFLMTTMILF